MITSRIWPSSTQTRLALILGAGGFLFFCLQLAAGSNWRDGAEFIGVATTFGVAHPTGYPVYSILGRLSVLLFSWITSPAIGSNLISAIAGGATLATLSMAAWKLSGLLRLGPVSTTVRVLASLVAVATLGSMTVFIEQAVVAEVYTLHTLFASILILLSLEGVLHSENPIPLLREGSTDLLPVRIWGPAGWRIPLLSAYVAGLALANHVTIVIFFPAFALFLWWMLYPESPQPEVFKPPPAKSRLVWVLIPLCALGLLALSMYLLLPMRASLDPPYNWGDAITLRRFFRLITAAEIRMRPPTYFPITAFGLWVKIAGTMGWPMFILSLGGWIWAGLRRSRLGIVTLVFLVSPMVFLLLKLDILDDALLPVHLFMALGTGAMVLLVGERLVRWLGPGMGGRAASVVVAVVIIIGPGFQIVQNWGLSTPTRQWGPEHYLETVISSVGGEPNPAGEVEGWVFAEDDFTAFMLWLQQRVDHRHPELFGIYLLLAREGWYQEELRENIPLLSVPALNRSYEVLPHEAASRELIAANLGSGKPLFLSPIILPSEDIYGVLVPQGVLLRMEPPGYQVSLDDIRRHARILEEYAPGFQRENLPALDPATRDQWSWRHSLLGEAWLRLGILPAAEAEFRAGVRVNPERPEPWMDLALFFSVVGDWEGMEATLREAIALRPRDQGLLIELARTLTRQGAFDEAERVLPTGRLKRVPREEYLRVRAGIRLGQGDATAARDDLEEAARLAPSSSEVWNDLGVVYLRKGQWNEAVPAFTRAVELQPDLGEAWANLGMIAFRDARWEEAEANLERARLAGVSNEQVGFNLGTARVNLNDLEGAEEVFRSNLREWPLHADTYITLAALLERDGRLQEALLILEGGRMAVPDDPRFGMILRRLRLPPLP